MNKRGLTRSVMLVGSLAALVVPAVATRYSLAVSSVSGQAERTSIPEGVSPVDKTQAENEGDNLMAEKKYQAAIREYEQAPQTSSIIWNKTGVAYHHLYNLAAAKSHYEKALRLNPNYAEAMNNLGTTFYTEKRYGPAEKLYKKALKLSPRDAAIYGNLGTMYFVQGKAQKGAEAYRVAFSLDPHVFERTAAAGIGEGIPPQQRAAMNYSLAKTYAQAGMNARALEYLGRALSEGFRDRKKLMEDKEFSALRETPEFRQLLSQPR